MVKDAEEGACQLEKAVDHNGKDKAVWGCA
jgi:hypothetical protein